MPCIARRARRRPKVQERRRSGRAWDLYGSISLSLGIKPALRNLWLMTAAIGDGKGLAWRFTTHGWSMREKSIGGAPVDAAPINRFATALTREPNCRRCNISHHVTARLRFVVANEREIRLFVTDRTNRKMPKWSPAGDVRVIPNRVSTRKAHTGKRQLKRGWSR